MKVVLKPGGLFLLAIVLCLLSFFAWRQPKQGVAEAGGAPPRVRAPTPAIATYTPRAAGSIVPNGDMSKTGADGVPEGWSVLWTGRGSLRLGGDAAVFHSGPRSLWVDTGGGDAKGQVGTTLLTKAGEKYRVTGFLRVVGRGFFSIAVQYYDSASKPVGFEHLLQSDLKGGWMSCDKQITVPAGATRFALLLYVDGAGKGWLDDVSVVPAH